MNNKLKIIRYTREGRNYLMIKDKEIIVKGQKIKKDVLYYQSGNILWQVCGVYDISKFHQIKK